MNQREPNKIGEDDKTVKQKIIEYFIFNYDEFLLTILALLVAVPLVLGFIYLLANTI
jgi:hypothetical protein